MKRNYKNFKKISFFHPFLLIILCLVFVAGISLGIIISYFYFQNLSHKQISPLFEKNIYIAFLSEIYDKIKGNYWENLSDSQLCQFFQTAIEKLVGPQPVLFSKNKKGLKKLLERIMVNMTDTQKKNFTLNVANLVLASLQPIGRNRLYTKEDKKTLQHMIQNINPEKNLYQSLELSKGASLETIKKAYRKKISQLKKDKSPQAKQKIKELNYAYKILSDPKKKQKYDNTGIEPTVLSELKKENIFYLKIQRFSPTTFEEFKKATEKVNNIERLNTLILDLRGNIGGSIDILSYFLGPFIGFDQYAFEFYHQGEKKIFKTKTGWLPSLVRYKKVIILIDHNTQSTAELMASVLKKYNVGVLVGTRTKGWGTVERVFEMKNQLSSKEKYSIFLVHSLTLREDGQPIEGRGVEPMVNINNPNWENQLFAYFHYSELVEVVKQILNQ